MINPEKKSKTVTSNKIESYRKTNVTTASKETILLMMYDAAIRFTKQAIEATKSKDDENRLKYAKKTQDIVVELRSTLNRDVDKDITDQLERLYEFVSHKLLTGIVEKSEKPLEEALAVLITLRNTWEEAINSLKNKTSTGC